MDDARKSCVSDLSSVCFRPPKSDLEKTCFCKIEVPYTSTLFTVRI